MFGTILTSGVQMIAKCGFSQRNIVIVSLSLAVGIGLPQPAKSGSGISPELVQSVFSANVVAGCICGLRIFKPGASKGYGYQDPRRVKITGEPLLHDDSSFMSSSSFISVFLKSFPLTIVILFKYNVIIQHFYYMSPVFLYFAAFVLPMSCSGGIYFVIFVYYPHFFPSLFNILHKYLSFFPIHGTICINIPHQLWEILWLKK